MQPRVTAILVARGGEPELSATLQALSAQTRAPDALVVVDSASGAAQLIDRYGPTQLIDAGPVTFGEGASLGARAVPDGPEEWLWLLGHDNAPDPGALAALIGAVERAPSVGLAGPKLMSSTAKDQLQAFGETLTRLGASVDLVANELDQGQHDGLDDVLGVAAAGMLVKHDVWTELAGFDPSLPSIDASLDFSVRARLAGHRVIVVPPARVASVGGPELFGQRTISRAGRYRIARAAQLHRRLVYAPWWALPLHWLSLLPLALLRIVGHLVAKNPGRVAPELAATLGALVDGGVPRARSNLQRTTRTGWAAIAPLRLPGAERRHRRGLDRDERLGEPAARSSPRAGFAQHGGLLTVLLLAVVGAFAFGPLIGAQALSGGALLPLSDDPATLWGQPGYGWRSVGAGMLGPADPFALVLAVLGSLTFWNPDQSIVLLTVAALPLASLGAWFALRRIVRNPWLPAAGALLWAIAPAFLSALTEGRLGAAIAHLLLPWLLLCVLAAERSWAASAGAGLLLAVICASVPSLIPALLLLWFIWTIVRIRSGHRLLGIPLPTVALFAPLAAFQLLRGTPLAIFADPGPAVAHPAVTGWQLALGDPLGSLHGWTDALTGLDAGTITAPVLVAVLLAPLALLGFGSLFLPGARRALPLLLIALLGYATAVAAGQLALTHDGIAPVALWAGGGLSLLWFGVVAAGLVALDATGRSGVPLAILAVLAGIAAVLPLLGSQTLGTAAVTAGNGRILPALVTAEAAIHPTIGTLVIRSQGDAGIAAELQRGAGDTLDDQSSYAQTTPELTETELAVATLAGNLVTRSGVDTAAQLRELGISFIVLAPATGDDDERHRIVAEALDSNELLTAVGTTSNGLLWRYDLPRTELPTGPANTGTDLGRIILIGWGVVFGVGILLAVPIGGRRRHRAANGPDEFSEFDGEEET